MEWQLHEVEKGLDSAARWLEATMAVEPSIEQRRESYTDWIMAEREQIGLDAEVVKTYELANPLGMSADGLLRYWKKARFVGQYK